MDEQIHKKEAIKNHIKKLKEENNLTQEDAVDAYQEMNRADKIGKHIIRSNKNTAGRLSMALIFGTVGYFVSLQQIPVRTGLFNARSLGSKLGYVIGFSVLGYIFGSYRLGNPSEVRRYSKMLHESQHINDEIMQIIDNLENLKRKH
jgi:hypothetical protein